METRDPQAENRNSKIENGSQVPGGESPVPDFQFQIAKASSHDRSTLKYVLVAAAVIVAVAVAFTVVSRMRFQKAAAPLELTSEQKSYLANIGFAGAKMSAATNFLGQRVIYLDAQISNTGPREVKQVEISMDFTDILGQTILRERAGVFPPASPPLKAGETRDFQLFFDRIPSDWNQAPPRITPVSVQF